MHLNMLLINIVYVNTAYRLRRLHAVLSVSTLVAITVMNETARYVIYIKLHQFSLCETIN